MAFSYYIVLALLFCTARRRNGFAAIQDLVTKTRVISRAALQSRPVLAAIELPPPAVESTVTVGPYHVLETLEKARPGEWLLGYDLRLLRKVWLRLVPPGTQAVPATLRNPRSVGRLRWLAGRRSPEENWDAFEAVTGKPLVKLMQAPNVESGAVLASRSGCGNQRRRKGRHLPAVLSLDRVWITMMAGPSCWISCTGVGNSQPLTHPSPHRMGRGYPSGRVRGMSNPSSARCGGGVGWAVDTGAKAVGEVAVPLPLPARAF